MHCSTNSNEQNGRQPPLSGQIVIQRPLQDPRFANQNPVPFGAKVDICRDFLWGTCTKTTQCKYRHELDFEEMKKVLRFCHDHQNRSGCIREDCTYLHVTKDEESLFLTSGQLPRVLAERHTNMLAATNSAETIPQIAHFIKESFVNAPPPPPPPPPPSSPPYAGGSQRPSTSQQPPPPPPPPPLPSSASGGVLALPAAVHPNMALAIPAPIQTPIGNQLAIPRTMPGVFAPTTPPVFAGPRPNVMYPVNLPPPNFPPMFDASVPPPPLPTGVQNIQTKSGATKRRIAAEAGPSKLRKTEDFRIEDELCPNCLQLQPRIGSCSHEVQQLEIEEEFQKIILQNKTSEYENTKYVLRSLVRPEVSRVLEEHVEGVPHFQLQDILAEINQATSVSTSLPSVVMLLLECLLKNSRNTPTASLRSDDALLQSVANLTRRNLSMPSSPSVLDALTGLIRNSTATAATPVQKELKMSATTSNGVNGFGRFNGQNTDEPNLTRVPSGYMNEVQRLRGPVVPSTLGDTHMVAGPSNYTSIALTVPPPVRHYYSQPYGAVPNNTNLPLYYQNYRPTAPVYGARANAPVAAPPQPNNKDSYMMPNRYPGPPQ